MPLHARSIAVNVAVACFFALSFVGWASGLSPFVCCKRAMTGAILAYVAVLWAVKAINAVLIRAMISDQISQQNRSTSAGNRKAVYKGKHRDGRNE
jgi:hypothetical protein